VISAVPEEWTDNLMEDQSYFQERPCEVSSLDPWKRKNQIIPVL